LGVGADESGCDDWKTEGADGELDDPDASVWLLTAGGGNDEIASSGDDVSTVMCFVAACAFRKVYSTGEHLTAIEGFL
jgi:hypothetical protein